MKEHNKGLLVYSVPNFAPIGKWVCVEDSEIQNFESVAILPALQLLGAAYDFKLFLVLVLICQYAVQCDRLSWFRQRTHRWRVKIFTTSSLPLGRWFSLDNWIEFIVKFDRCVSHAGRLPVCGVALWLAVGGRRQLRIRSGCLIKTPIRLSVARFR